MACCGAVPALETLAAVKLLRKYFPKLKVRVINVVDLMKLQPQSEHPHGLSDRDFDTLFTKDKPIIFAHHGKQALRDKLIQHKQYIAKHGQDLPEIRNWKWSNSK